MWAVREGIPEAMSHAPGCGGVVFKYDVSLPQSQMYDLVTRLRGQMKVLNSTPNSKDKVFIVGYGHFGDGNIHLNVALPHPDRADQMKRLDPTIYAAVRDAGGSISAEHGIGVLKTPYLSHSKSRVEIELMRQVKNIFDPKGILNPYKVLDSF
jgi:FAD/FMN-containing dehydrogenase